MTIEFDNRRRAGVGALRLDDSARARAALVFWAFGASRIALLIVGLLTQILIQPHSTFTHHWAFSHFAGANMWGVWDSDWYRAIAVEGYDDHVHPDGYVTWVFFPAYPVISAAIAKITHLPVFWSMLAVSNLSFLAALFLIHREATDEFDRPTGDIAVLLFCVAPGSYVFSSGYTESLFLLALTGSLVLMRRRRWLAAGTCAALATLTRNLGVGLLLPMAFLAAPRILPTLARRSPGADGSRATLEEVSRILAGMILPVLAIAGFCLFLYTKTGNPLAFITAQQGWHRSVGSPFDTLFGYLERPETLLDQDLVSFAFAWLSVGLFVALAWMRKWSLLLLGAFFVGVALAAGVGSYQRYCMSMLPLFLAAAKLLSDRPAARAALIPSIALLGGFMMVTWTLGMVVAA